MLPAGDQALHSGVSAAGGVPSMGQASQGSQAWRQEAGQFGATASCQQAGSRKLIFPAVFRRRGGFCLCLLPLKPINDPVPHKLSRPTSHHHKNLTTMPQIPLMLMIARKSAAPKPVSLKQWCSTHRRTHAAALYVENAVQTSQWVVLE